MDNLLDRLVRAARRCERAARPFEREPLLPLRERLVDACQRVGQSWSGSWLGYHASVYLQGLRPRNAGEYFDSEWGGTGIHNHSVGPWAEYRYEAVRDEIFRQAGADDLASLNEAAREAGEAFRAAKQEAIPALDALLGCGADATLERLRSDIDKLRDHFSREEFVSLWRPRGQHMTRDTRALTEGLRPPHHYQVQAWVLERSSWGEQAAALARLLRQVAQYLQDKRELQGGAVAKKDGAVFIGHGGSPAWRDLKDFLQDRLGLAWEEFNREPTAGHTTKERLEAMLDNACFAFLVMTAEDERADGTTQARANVIHEAGLFQGRLGFERAIILLEEGCAEFSNIIGLTQIRFPKGNIMAKSEEVRRVLEREGIIS